MSMESLLGDRVDGDSGWSGEWGMDGAKNCRKVT